MLQRRRMKTVQREPSYQARAYQNYRLIKRLPFSNIYLVSFAILYLHGKCWMLTNLPQKATIHRQWCPHTTAHHNKMAQNGHLDRLVTRNGASRRNRLLHKNYLGAMRESKWTAARLWRGEIRVPLRLRRDELSLQIYRNAKIFRCLPF